MIRNFFIVAIRNLWRNRFFSTINMMGLSIGMASSILILLWIRNEVSFDRFYAKEDRLFMIYNRDKIDGEVIAWPATPKILGPTLKNEFPEVDETVRVRQTNFLFTVGDKHLNLPGNFADSNFLSLFSFPLLEGNPATALNNLHQIVITESMAKKLFGKQDAMGKILRIDSAENFTVTGILKELPANTRFRFDYLLPWSYMTKLGWDDNYWQNNSVETYITLKPGVSEEAFNKRFQNVTINHTKGDKQISQTELFLHPAAKWHLYSRFENGKIAGGQIEIVRYFFIIAGFLLLIACINFMNLSTARSEKRAKEVGIRKVVGAPKIYLILQFLGESVLISAFAGMLALVIVQLCLGSFNQLVNKNLIIDFKNPGYWISGIGFILLTGFIAGSYPAFYLSSVKPAKVLMGSFKVANTLITPRKLLVVIQFTFAIVLIISTIIVQHQIQFARNRDSGYAKDRLVYCYIQGDLDKNYSLIRNELISSGAAVGVVRTNGPITRHWSSTWGIEWTGSNETDKKVDFNLLSADVDFVKTIGVKLVQGRDINIREYGTDSNAIILNETAVKMMHVKDPIGLTVKINGNYHVVGVIKDFILESPYQSIQPLLIMGPAAGGFYILNYKLNPARTVAEDMRLAESVFKKYNSSYPFEYYFVDEEYAAKFDNEKRSGSFAALFAGLAIFISCLGLFGLASYMAENRIKEIGVRKVLGASVTNITTLLSKDFLKPVLLSFLIASPLAWLAMSKWLQSYAYRIDISWWIFGMAGVLSILIALLTVSIQSVRAAMENPVKSLRSE